MGCIEFTAEQIERAHDELAYVCLRESRVDADAIAREVAARHRLTVNEMLGPSRDHEFVVARAQLYRALRQRGWSFPKIGRFVNRDHTTVLAALRGVR